MLHANITCQYLNKNTKLMCLNWNSNPDSLIPQFMFILWHLYSKEPSPEVKQREEKLEKRSYLRSHQKESKTKFSHRCVTFHSLKNSVSQSKYYSSHLTDHETETKNYSQLDECQMLMDKSHLKPDGKFRTINTSINFFLWRTRKQTF